MLYRIAADLVLVIHLAFVAFVVLGALLLLRWPRLMGAHLVVLAWGIAIELAGFICPLTPLENWLRQRGGEAGYEGGFIQHYITSLLYPEGLTRTHQIVLGVVLVTFNAVIYGYLLHRRRRGSA